MVPSSRGSASHSAHCAAVLASLIELRIIPESLLEISTSNFSSCAAQPKDSDDIKYKILPTGILVMYILSMAAEHFKAKGKEKIARCKSENGVFHLCHVIPSLS